MQAFDVQVINERLTAANGDYEIVHESPGLEVGVYVLVASTPTVSSRMRTTSSTSSSRGRCWTSKASRRRSKRAPPS